MAAGALQPLQSFTDPITQAPNSIEVIHSPGTDSVEIHRGVAVTPPHPRHWHEEFHACAVTGGGGYVEYRGAEHLTPPGTVFLLAPGEVHANRCTDGGCSYKNIYIPAAQVLRAIAQVTGAAKDFPFLPLVVDDERTHAGFLSLCSILERPASQLQRESTFLMFFGQVIKRFGECSGKSSPNYREPQAVTRVREFLEEHFDEEISLKELAKLTNLSPYHLNRTFCKEIGIPPHAYQIQRRIAQAKRLLRQRWPIAHVAHCTGFADQSHFTRHFKRFVGITPGQYFLHSKNVQDRTLAPN
jgi:AraC-like DNA-binding protein